MKKKTTLIGILVAGVAFLFVAAALQAGTTVSDVIKMQNKIYESHEKGIVEFTHKKHFTDYGAGCGDCHHDDKGQPLTDLKEGDDVQGCAECHSKPGELKGRDARGKSKAEKLEYHANALHDNCKDCHREYNKKNKTKAAPTTCTKCHPKE